MTSIFAKIPQFCRYCALHVVESYKKWQPMEHDIRSHSTIVWRIRRSHFFGTRMSFSPCEVAIRNSFRESWGDIGFSSMWKVFMLHLMSALPSWSAPLSPILILTGSRQCRVYSWWAPQPDGRGCCYKKRILIFFATEHKNYLGNKKYFLPDPKTFR